MFEEVNKVGHSQITRSYECELCGGKGYVSLVKGVRLLDVAGPYRNSFSYHELRGLVRTGELACPRCKGKGFIERQEDIWIPEI